MNNDIFTGNNLINQIIKLLEKENANPNVKIVIAPPYTNLSEAKEIIKNNTLNIYLSAQNCHYEDKGAFTGEISPSMLDALSVSYVILGHSERRLYFNEKDTIIAKKITSVINHKMTPIYCCGELLEERENNTYKTVIKKQIEEALFSLSNEQMQSIVIAYEPVWAIGTGKNATSQEAQEVHQFIRQTIKSKYGTIADNIPILYGGSCKPDNAQEIFTMPDIDGGLIGGASLKASEFISIWKSLKSSKTI